MYTFDTILLSAVKAGNPPPTNTSLSAYGVNTIRLDADDVGITFNAKTGETGTLINTDISNSDFRIDTIYDGETLAIVKTTPSNLQSYTVFQFQSAYGTSYTVPTSAITEDVSQVTTPDSRRMWHLGYV